LGCETCLLYLTSFIDPIPMQAFGRNKLRTLKFEVRSFLFHLLTHPGL